MRVSYLRNEGPNFLHLRRPNALGSIQPLTQQHVKQYSKARWVKVRGLDICRVSILPYHKLCHSAENILRDPSHVLNPVLQHRYQPIISGRYDEIREGLWLITTSNPMHKTKVVRSWARRRVSQAILEQLRARGFDGNGRRIAALETASPGYNSREGLVNARPDALVGTVDIEVLNPCVQKDYKEIQRQAGALVESVMSICGRSQAEDKPLIRPKFRKNNQLRENALMAG